MPYPAELATLLALPPAAREALARCKGPGWLCSQRATTAHASATAEAVTSTIEMLTARGGVWAWLPASEAAILALVPDAPALDRSERGDWRAWSEGLTSGWCATARLAALRLLAAVSS